MKVFVRNSLLSALGIGIAIFVVAISPLLVESFRQSRSLVQAFDKYGDSLVSQRFDDAYAQCGTDFSAAMSYDQFVHFYKSLQDQFGPLKSVRRVGYEFHGKGTPMAWRGVVDADFLYEKKTLRFEFVLHNASSRWVIFGVEQL